MTQRPGFALLAALWLVIGLGVLAAAVGGVAQRALLRAQSEHDRIAGRWRAEGCISKVEARVNDALSRSPQEADAAWRSLDQLVPTLLSTNTLVGCDLSFRPDGRIDLTHATASDLDSLPGMAPEAVARVMEARTLGIPIRDLAAIGTLLSPEAKAIFEGHYAELSRRLTIDPDAWVVRSRAHLGTPPTPVNIEVRLVRSGAKATVARWVEW